MLKDKRKAIIFTIIAMFLWGSATPTIKITYEELAVPVNDTGLKIFVAGIRFLMAGIITLLFAKIFNKEDIENAKLDWKFILLLGILQTCIHYIFFYIGLSNTLGVKSAIIEASNSFIVVLISLILIPGDKVSKRLILSLVLGTVGIIITNIGGGLSDTNFKLTGEGFIIMATTVNALCSVLVRKYGQNQNSYLLTGFQFIIGSIVLILIGITTKHGSLTFTNKGLILLIYSSILSAAAFTIWTMVLRYHSASEFGIYRLFIPIFGSILSIIFLKEQFTVYLAIGMILVLSSSIVLNFRKPDKSIIKK